MTSIFVTKFAAKKMLKPRIKHVIYE